MNKLITLVLVFSLSTAADAETYNPRETHQYKSISPYVFGAHTNFENAAAWIIPATAITGPFNSLTIGSGNLNPSSTAMETLFNNALQPTQWQNIGNNGVCNGLRCAYAKITGGFGSYGVDGITVDFDGSFTPKTGSSYFGRTTWISSGNNVAGQQVNAQWIGVNSPSKVLGHTWNASSSGITGAEINFGNRWGNLGVPADIGGRVVTGMLIVPDVIPSSQGSGYNSVLSISDAGPVTVRMSSEHDYVPNMGIVFFCSGKCSLPSPLREGIAYYVAGTITDNTFQLSAVPGSSALINTTGSMSGTVNILPSYASSFGVVLAHSNYGNQIATGYMTRSDTISPEGYGIVLNGNSTSAVNQPAIAIEPRGYWRSGINFSRAMFANDQVVVYGDRQSFAWTGGARVLGSGSSIGINNYTPQATLDVGGTLRAQRYTLPTESGTLPACTSSILGAIAAVSNGANYTDGPYGTTADSPGSVTRLVLCTNTSGETTYAWAYN